jgi:predicted secreted hydrolase
MMSLILRACVLALCLLPVAAAVTGEAPAASPSELATALGAGDDAGFAKAIAPRRFSFPADHGPHPEFRNEWWYVTGNLESDDGERFGYELTIFRVALAPTVPASPSNWRTNQLYFAHFALTRPGEERFHAAERYARGAAGLAGAKAEPFRVWLHDWALSAMPDGRWRLEASDEDLRLELALRPLKAPVLQGDDGLSQKSAEPGNASYYYSLTRLASAGVLAIGNEIFEVSGLSWLDREWSTSALAPGQSGWDWFALQFDDGTELMLYGLRLTDGRLDDLSAGSFVHRDGRITRLDREDFEIEVTRTWTSPLGGTYPARWSMRIPSLAIDLDIQPVMENQELDTVLRYWEGAVDVRGSHSGRGYVELTGYAE